MVEYDLNVIIMEQLRNTITYKNTNGGKQQRPFVFG
jgi:hypothetical protein